MAEGQCQVVSMSHAATCNFPMNRIRTEANSKERAKQNLLRSRLSWIVVFQVRSVLVEIRY